MIDTLLYWYVISPEAYYYVAFHLMCFFTLLAAEFAWNRYSIGVTPEDSIDIDRNGFIFGAIVVLILAPLVMGIGLVRFIEKILFVEIKLPKKGTK